MKVRRQLGSVSVAFILLGTLAAACGGDDSGDGDNTATTNPSSGGSGGSGGSDGGSAGASSTTQSSGGSGSGGTLASGGNGSGGGATSAGGAAGDAGAAGASGAAGADTNTGGTSAGGSTSEPVCGGTAVECSTYTTDATCAAQIGCSVGGACDGDAQCADHADRSACEADGCEWLTPCMPVANCNGSEAACNAKVGCEWNADEGSCSIKLDGGCVDITTEVECTLMIGCAWADENFFCSGTATACDELGEDVCSLQEGCSEL